MRTQIFLLLSLQFLTGCAQTATGEAAQTAESAEEAEAAVYPPYEHGNPWQYLDSLRPADGFDYPVGKPDAKGYYDAQPFGVNTHLGEDWNAVTGGRSDFGKPVYAIADGRVFFAEDVHGGWGNVIRLVHAYTQANSTHYVESLYGHCDSVWVHAGDRVRRGQQIGTIGDAHGLYSPHLHLEIREQLGRGIEGGYAADNEGWLSPKVFIKARRPR